MADFRDSLSKKLTAMNMLVSGGALLLASLAFFAYDLYTFRANLISNTSVQAEMIGSDAVSPLIFNDVRSAQNALAAMRVAQHVVYAAIYTAKGDFLAGYWRDQPSAPVPLPSLHPINGEIAAFKQRMFDLEQEIVFEGKPMGFVYIRSDLGALTDRLKTYALILVVIVGVSLIAALALSQISQRKVAQPILKLAETARKVSRERDYAVRAQATGDHDEVAFLVDAFNEMLNEIQTRDSALQVSERQFRTVADSIPQMAWIAEADGRMSWFNHRWYEYTGASPDEMLGWGWEAVHDPEMLPEVRKNWRESTRTGQPFEMIFPLRAEDGSFRDFLTRAMAVRDVHGKVARWFGTNTDITEQRRAEQALRQTEKLAATGRLAASIAHEINNPLEAVTNLVYLARIQPANVQKYLKLADQELDRIAQITKNTLGFYRDTSSPSLVNVSEALEEVVALYSRKAQFKKIDLRPDYGNGIVIAGVPGEIRQILANLLANAIEALPESGHLRIRARETPGWDGTRQAGVRITFLDDGTGIAPERLKKIFEPFYTTKKDVGTGLGLWLTLGLVGKHHGTLHVRSSVKAGYTWTAFSLFLPKEAVANTLLPSKEGLADLEAPSS